MSDEKLEEKLSDNKKIDVIMKTLKIAFPKEFGYALDVIWNDEK